MPRRDRHRRAVARHAAGLVRCRDPRRRRRRSARRRGPASPRRPARPPRRRHAAIAPSSTRRSTGLGAALDVGVSRDAVTLSGLALSRHLDAVIDLAADILAEPRFDEDEHARLLRETPQVLDEIRDDDSALATRWFDWLCCPGHPYGRTSLGTEASLARIERATPRSTLWQREVVADNLVIGLAGDIDEATAARDRRRASTERLPARRRAPRARPSDRARTPPGRRMILVDKPDRTQAQLRIGHLALALRPPRHRRARDRRGRVRRHVQLAPDAGDPGQARLELRRRLRAAPLAPAALVRDLDGGRHRRRRRRPSRSRSSCSPTTPRTARPTTRSTSRAATSSARCRSTSRPRASACSSRCATRCSICRPATPRGCPRRSPARRDRRARRVQAPPAPRRRRDRRGDHRGARRRRARRGQRRPVTAVRHDEY